MTGRRRIAWLSAFALAMAYLEAAVVVYLRRIHYHDDPLSLFPLRVWSSTDLLIELGREAATVVMILAAAALAERGGARIFAAFAYVFGVWDVFYYFWLKVLLGWPTAWLEWDILFLIPWVWLGPWPTPALVGIVLALWGGRVVAGGRPCRFSRGSGLAFGAGALLVLASFLEPASSLLPAGPSAAASFVPGRFLWLPWAAGLALMSAGLFATLSAGEEKKNRMGKGRRAKETVNHRRVR